MVEQGLNYAQEHQAWSRVRRIGQTQTQYTERLVNVDTIDVMIEASQRNRQNPMMYAFMKLDSIDNSLVEAGDIYDLLIGKEAARTVLGDVTIGGDDSRVIVLDDDVTISEDHPQVTYRY